MVCNGDDCESDGEEGCDSDESSCCGDDALMDATEELALAVTLPGRVAIVGCVYMNVMALVLHALSASD